MSGTYKIVDTIVTPFASTVYTVTGVANISQTGSLAGTANCFLAAVNGGGTVTSFTEQGFAHLAAVGDSQTIPETGVLHVSPLGVIEELCAGTTTMKAFNAGMSATRLNSGFASAPPRNKFIKLLKPVRSTFKH
jgi:hypothetical protein